GRRHFSGRRSAHGDSETILEDTHSRANRPNRHDLLHHDPAAGIAPSAAFYHQVCGWLAWPKRSSAQAMRARHLHTPTGTGRLTAGVQARADLSVTHTSMADLPRQARRGECSAPRLLKNPSICCKAATMRVASGSSDPFVLVSTRGLCRDPG